MLSSKQGAKTRKVYQRQTTSFEEQDSNKKPHYEDDMDVGEDDEKEPITQVSSSSTHNTVVPLTAVSPPPLPPAPTAPPSPLGRFDVTSTALWTDHAAWLQLRGATDAEPAVGMVQFEQDAAFAQHVQQLERQAGEEDPTLAGEMTKDENLLSEEDMKKVRVNKKQEHNNLEH